MTGKLFLSYCVKFWYDVNFNINVGFKQFLFYFYYYFKNIGKLFIYNYFCIF